MSNEKIILELKEIYKNNDLIKLKSLIEKMEQDYKEKQFINNVNDKNKISTIKKILTSAEKNRPILGAYSRQGDYVVFTDGYEAFYLKDDKLPFKYASCLYADDENYIKKHNLEVIEGVYPDILNCIKEKDVNNIINYKVDELLKLEKITPKNDKNTKFFEIKDKNGDLIVTINLIYLVNVIKILKLKDTIKLEIFGKYDPVYIKNDIGEIAILMPIKVN